MPRQLSMKPAAVRKRKYLEKKRTEQNSPSSLNPSQNPNPSQPDEQATVLPEAESVSPARQLGRNEKKYEKLLDDYLGPTSGILVLCLCLFMYGFSLEDSERIADHLAMTQAEQSLIIPPLAGLLDKLNLDTKARDRLLQSGDIIGLTLGITSYGARVVGSLRELKGQLYGTRGYAPQQAAQPGAASSNGHYAAWGGGAVSGLGQYRAD